MIAALLLFAFCACVQSTFVYQSGVSFEAGANVTLAAPDSRFNYRHTTFAGTPNLWFYTSIQAAESTSGNTVSASANGVVGVGFLFAGIFGIAAIPPTTYLAFFNVSADATNVAGTTSYSAVDVAASVAVVGKVYEQLQEIDVSGNVVSTVSFTSITFSSPNSGLNTVQVADSSLGLSFMTMTATTTGGATIAITYATSSVLGKLVGGATITPTSVESYFEIDGYTYVTAGNHLRLTLYVGHVSASASVSGTTTVVAGSGPDQISIVLSGTATVNGVTEPVTVSGTGTIVPTSQIPSQSFSSQLSGHASYKAEARQITIDFPAGATSFTYDPSIGFGAPNSGWNLVPSSFLLLLSALLLRLF